MSTGPSLVIDGIVFNLQAMGGISVLFREILSRLPEGGFEFIGYGAKPPAGIRPARHEQRNARLLERYRSVPVAAGTRLFHSTYYRVPERRNTPCVTTVYDFVYERFVGGMRTAVHSRQKRAAIERADAIICISQSTRDDVARYIGPAAAARAVVVPCGVSEGFGPVEGAPVESQVLFVGQRGGYKNFVSALEALAGLPGLRLRCVGGGPFTEAELALVARHIPGRAQWLGYLSDEALNAEYNHALCLLYPSLFEGFGIPVVEAMRAGCPVVGVAAGAVPEVAADAAILTERGDSDELRQAIGSLLVSANRQALVHRGFARAQAFSWQRTYMGTRQVYESLLGRSLDAST